MSDAFLELMAKAKPDHQLHAELLLDTNVMMEIYSIGDLLRDGDQLGAKHGADAMLAAPKFRYRILRARHSIILAWTLAQTGTVVGVLGNEVVDLLENVMAPKDDNESYAITTAIIHVAMPRILAGLRLGPLNDVDHHAKKAAADQELLRVATRDRLPLVTNEGLGERGVSDTKGNGEVNLRGLCRVEDIEDWIEGMRRKTYVPGKGKATGRKTRSSKSEPRTYSAGTIKGYYRVLSQIITAGCARSRVPNPCDGVEAPTAGKRRKNFLGTDEVAGVLAHVAANAPGWYAAVLLDVLSGLRWGELSALRWDDIDEREGVIRVRRGNDKGREVASTKTGDDDDEPKLVPLLPQVADVLRERRQQMVRDQHPGLAAAWIFPTERGSLHKGSPLRDVLDAACAACKTKRRITPHGLRHAANDLLRRVADGEVVRAIIGHSTPQMTHHYSHVDEQEKRSAAIRALDVVTGGKGVIAGVATTESAIASADPKSENPAVAGSSVRGATQI